MKALKDTWPVVVTLFTCIGFLWLNVPTKSDFDKLESKMATKEDLGRLETNIAKLESRMATKEDLGKLETTITTALAIYRDEVKQVKSELQKHTLNYAAHK
jgi:hypothetical protein